MTDGKNARRVVMQKIINGIAFHASETFVDGANAESWIRKHEAEGYRVASDKTIEPKSAEKQ